MGYIVTSYVIDNPKGWSFMKKKLAVLAFVLVLLSVFIYIKVNNQRKNDELMRRYIDASEATINLIKSIPADDLEFIIKSNPINNAAPTVIVSDGIFYQVTFDAKTTVLTANDDIKKKVRQLIGSMKNSTVDVKENLTPGTPPASISFYNKTIAKGYVLHLMPTEVNYIFRDNNNNIICHIAVDSATATNLLQAVGYKISEQ